MIDIDAMGLGVPAFKVNNVEYTGEWIGADEIGTWAEKIAGLETMPIKEAFGLIREFLKANQISDEGVDALLKKKPAAAIFVVHSFFTELQSVSNLL